MEDPIDLTKLDTYPDENIPSADVETCLKVLRTLRNVCLIPETFSAHGALNLSHAHATIHDMVKRLQETK